MCTTSLYLSGQPHFEMIFVVVFYVYFSEWFCTRGSAEIRWFTDLFVWSFAFLTMLRADMVSYYTVFVGTYIHKQFESTILAVNVIVYTLKFKNYPWNFQMSWELISCSCYLQLKQRIIMAVLLTCSCSCSEEWIPYHF